ncbi:hypothetical protein KXJ69_01550 [Aureisphaera sp. CAU 1614]|uniref:Uncharacterized protein n=1 Tax=Halomarinibacterium sedimenti TaxID=2857106 RepID=A0A9X1JUM0_9FLAO|nr:hypothetical protein [Halomarinibacterium sedimenti]MBW2936770.1 hypothetical protein [Halomarinibacterium sedimenti]
MNIPLEEQRIEFAKRKFLAMPFSGLIAWLLVSISGMFLPNSITIWVLLIASSSIVYVALFISKFTGENYLDKIEPKKMFNGLFLYAMIKASLIYAIVIPFFIIEYTSLPLTIGLLTGIHWIQFSKVIKHWVGIFHVVIRTVSILIFWVVFPEQRFLIIPICILIIYIITLIILTKKNKKTCYEIRNCYRVQ